MKKIGIMTFQNSNNCGSIMQAYALQNVLENKYGCKVEFINYSNKGQQNMYNVFSKKVNLKNIVKNAMFLFHYKRLKSDYNSYKNFVKKNLSVQTSFYEKKEDLNKIASNYDLYITGSDQVWNITCEDFDDSYFLDFVRDKKKVSYATSLGAMNIKRYADDVERYKKYLDELDFISVRERNAKKWIGALTKKEIKIVADPTLLIDIEEYEKIENKVSINEKYIFCYSCNYRESADYIKEISDKYNLPVIMWNSKQWITKGLKSKGFELPDIQDPGVFLYLIKNATLVLTSSYHGTILSTVYNKNFWVLKTGGMLGDDDRVSYLLEQLGLLDRFLEKKDNKDIMIPVDYSKYKVNLERLRKNAFEYIETFLK